MHFPRLVNAEAALKEARECFIKGPCPFCGNGGFTSGHPLECLGFKIQEAWIDLAEFNAMVAAGIHEAYLVKP